RRRECGSPPAGCPPMSKKSLKLGFLGFVKLLFIRVRGELVPFWDVATDYQKEALKALAPSVEALSRGEMAEMRKFWLEATKGAGKDMLVAAVCIYLLLTTSWSA